VLSIVPAALLVASVAFAAKPQTASATLTSLAASGVTGSADFKIDANGNARIHESITGLTPGTQYTSVVYIGSTTCASGVSVQIMSFTANAAGRANFNTVLPPQAVPAANGNASISVQQGTTLVACGEVVQQ
jgi:hypothetical protein